MRRYIKAFSYQFGLANVSGFRDHSNIKDSRTNRNTHKYLFDSRNDTGMCVYSSMNSITNFEILKKIAILFSNDKNIFQTMTNDNTLISVASEFFLAQTNRHPTEITFLKYITLH